MLGCRRNLEAMPSLPQNIPSHFLIFQTKSSPSLRWKAASSLIIETKRSTERRHFYSVQCQPVEFALKFWFGAFLSLDCSAAEWKRAFCLIRRNVYQFECNFPALQEAQKGILTFTLGKPEELDNICWKQDSFLL